MGSVNPIPPPPGGPAAGPRKDLRPLYKLPRSALLSYMQRAAAAHGYFNQLSAFRGGVLWGWIPHYLSHRIGRRHPFLTYGSASDQGIYRLADEKLIGGKSDPEGQIRVSLVGDWGTGTDEAYEVAQRVKKFMPHWTIHLGDVYYVGDDQEVEENCLGGPAYSQFAPTEWPWGAVGSFALNGNHEMYALGRGYFTKLLPRMGIRRSPGGSGAGQKASFFCLENDFWRVIALDTGYHCAYFPVLDYFFQATWLDQKQMQWLANQVNPKQDERGLILLGHHQYGSAFEAEFHKQSRQLSGLIDRSALWFWGHEHRLAIYGKVKSRGGIEAYGRCIGHGGMPIEVSAKPKKGRTQPVVYDNRPYHPPGENFVSGFNGYVNLTFNRNRLTIDYVDLTGSKLVTEWWETQGGRLCGQDIQLHNPALQHETDLFRAIR